MLDIRRLRETSDEVSSLLARRGLPDIAARIDEALEADRIRREGLTEVNELKRVRNERSREVGARKRAGEATDDLIEEVRSVNVRIDELEADIARAEAARDVFLMETPNVPLDEVPPGGEDCNQVLREWGEEPVFGFEPVPHWDVGESLGILDLARGSKVSGSGFPVLVGAGARLQRTLIDFMIDLHVRDHGYTEVRVPYLVTRESLTGTGQLPKFADESYVTERDDLWLIPTAEVSVTNLHRAEELPAPDLPKRYVAYSPCFRREAGAAGKDTRGLLRVHQFDKVELVRFEEPERSREALEELTAEASRVLELLGLRYRVVRLAGGDLGFSAALTLDLEVWAPGVGRWLEVSSCSTFTDFQARRLGVRFRPSGGAGLEFVHTLNGSGLALPRVVVALLETGQREDGSVALPQVLHERLGFDSLPAPAAARSP